jgi:hypothetical protein
MPMNRTRAGAPVTHAIFCARTAIGVAIFMKPTMPNMPASKICAIHKLT